MSMAHKFKNCFLEYVVYSKAIIFIMLHKKSKANPIVSKDIHTLRNRDFSQVKCELLW